MARRRSVVRADANKNTRSVNILRRRSGRTPDTPSHEGMILRDSFDTRATPISRTLQSYSLPSMFRAGAYTHVSDLVGKCPRMLALVSSTGGRHVVDSIRPGTGITFAIGTAVGDYVVRSAAATFGDDEVYGNWGCACGATSHLGVRVDAMLKTCPKCETSLSRYGEFVMRDDEYRVIGSVDLTLLRNNAFYFTEVKSKAQHLLEALTAPEPDHVIQALFYWWLARRNRHNVHSHVSVLYVNKGWTMRSPYVEYVIDAENMVGRLDPYLEEAKNIAPFKADRSDGSAPAMTGLPVKQCPNPQSPQAKKCVMCSTCFSV